MKIESLTYGEVNNLTKNSKHKHIGRVQLSINLETRELSCVDVYYKSGRHFCYKSIPSSVKDFLNNQTAFTTYVNKKTQIVIYFMA